MLVFRLKSGATRLSLRIDEERTFVVLLLFAGERQTGDIHECIEKQALFHGLSVFVTSADLATDSRWDLTDPTTFSQLLDWLRVTLMLLGGSSLLHCVQSSFESKSGWAEARSFPQLFLG